MLPLSVIWKTIPRTYSEIEKREDGVEWFYKEIIIGSFPQTEIDQLQAPIVCDLFHGVCGRNCLRALLNPALPFTRLVPRWYTCLPRWNECRLVLWALDHVEGFEERLRRDAHYSPDAFHGMISLDVEILCRIFRERGRRYLNIPFFFIAHYLDRYYIGDGLFQTQLYLIEHADFMRWTIREIIVVFGMMKHTADLPDKPTLRRRMRKALTKKKASLEEVSMFDEIASTMAMAL